MYQVEWRVVPLLCEPAEGWLVLRTTYESSLSGCPDGRVASLHEAVSVLLEGTGCSALSPHEQASGVPSALQTPRLPPPICDGNPWLVLNLHPPPPHHLHPLKFHFTTHKAR